MKSRCLKKTELSKKPFKVLKAAHLKSSADALVESKTKEKTIKIPFKSAAKGVGNVSLSGATCSIRVAPLRGFDTQGFPWSNNEIVFGHFMLN